MAVLFYLDGRYVSIKRDWKIRCFVASEFFTMEYNTIDH